MNERHSIGAAPTRRLNGAHERCRDGGGVQSYR